jgi:PadR family transcriptional regulator PadR
MNFNKWQAQFKRGILEMVIMKLLDNKASYGFKIIELLDEILDLKIAEGTLYPIFSRLEKDGVLVSKWVFGKTTHPRRYYSLSKKGEKVLEKMLNEWETYVTNINNLLNFDKKKIRELYAE